VRLGLFFLRRASRDLRKASLTEGKGAKNAGIVLMMIPLDSLHLWRALPFKNFLTTKAQRTRRN
jgi:hypothetical protein